MRSPPSTIGTIIRLKVVAGACECPGPRESSFRNRNTTPVKQIASVRCSREGKRGTIMSLSLITNIGSLHGVQCLDQQPEPRSITSIAQLSSGKRIVSAATIRVVSRSRSRPRVCSARSTRPVPTPPTRSRSCRPLTARCPTSATCCRPRSSSRPRPRTAHTTATQLTSIDSQYQAILTSINQIANGASSTGFRCSPAPRSRSRWARLTPPTISSR